MPIDCFLDTNVLVYGAVGREDEARKAAIAREIVRTQLFGVSAQTLAEFYAVVTRLALANYECMVEAVSR